MFSTNITTFFAPVQNTLTHRAAQILIFINVFECVMNVIFYTPCSLQHPPKKKLIGVRSVEHGGHLMLPFSNQRCRKTLLR